MTDQEFERSTYIGQLVPALGARYHKNLPDGYLAGYFGGQHAAEGQAENDGILFRYLCGHFLGITTHFIMFVKGYPGQVLQSGVFDLQLSEDPFVGTQTTDTIDVFHVNFPAL